MGVTRGQGERLVEAKGSLRVKAEGMSRSERFEDWLVWQKAMDLVTRIYKICGQGPLSKDWGLRDQLQRAAVSVPANIAEGYERASRKEYIHFLTIAKGSIGELRCLLHVSSELHYFDETTSASLINYAVEISKMLGGLLASLKC